MNRDKYKTYIAYFTCATVLLSGMLFACTPAAEAPGTPQVALTPSAVPTHTPLPTWTPTPLPTPTPIPPAQVRVIWPAAANALEPVPIEVEFIAPPGVAAQTQIAVTVMDPESETYAVFHLTSRDGSHYFAGEQLQLPLDPLDGYWFVIAEIDSTLDVEGMPVKFFVPEQIQFRPLEGILPEGVKLQVPIAFDEVNQQGDIYAGSRIWQHREGQIGLWWAPGPTENLLLSNAVTMLEATFPADPRPVITDVVETMWQDRTTFIATLAWPDAQPGMAWIVQDADFWLYVLEIHALDQGEIPTLIDEVASTFAFIDEQP